MIRTAILLAGLFLASAHDQVECGLNGARAVDDMLDSATYIWAAVKRCQKETPTSNAANGGGSMVLCAMDVSAAIEAVNAMVNVILKGVQDCGHLESEHEKCGMAVGVLTKSFAGLSAATAGVTAKCEYKLGFLVQQPGINQGNSALAEAAQQASFGQCLVDVKDTTKSLFKATKRILTVKENCDGDDAHDCAHNALKIVAGFAGMGEYLAGAIGRCTADTVANRPLREGAECAEHVMELIRHLHDVGRAGVDMSKYCGEGVARLYELEHGGVEESKTGSSVTLVLAALLPISAVLSFVGGSRFAKGFTQVADVE